MTRPLKKGFNNNLIGLDARVAHLKAGIGRYASELLRHFAGRQNYLAFLNPCLACPPQTRCVYTKATPIRYQEQLVLPWLIRRHRVKIFHSVYHNLPLLPTPARQLTTVHDLAYDDLPAERATLKGHLAYRIYLGTILKRSVRIITPSSSVKDALVRRWGYPAGRIRVIPMGVGEGFFRRPAADDTRRYLTERFKLKGPYFLFVGANRPRKNLGRLLKAFQIFLQKTGAAAQLVIVTNKDRRFLDVDKTAGRLKLKDRVRRLELQNDSGLIHLYRGCLAYLHPSLLEGFGITVLEALASGRAVLASPTGVTPELPPGSLLIVNPRDPVAIAAGIQRLWEDAALRKRLADSGPGIARRYGWKTTAEKTWQVYEEVLKTSN